MIAFFILYSPKSNPNIIAQGLDETLVVTVPQESASGLQICPKMHIVHNAKIVS